MSTYKVEDLIKCKRIISETMSILQTMLDCLYRKDVLKGASIPEQELIFDLESTYGNSEDVLKDIEAVIADIPPWNEAYKEAHEA